MALHPIDLVYLRVSFLGRYVFIFIYDIDGVLNLVVGFVSPYLRTTTSMVGYSN